MKKRVVIVEDQTMLRELLTSLLNQEGSYEVVGAYGEGREALAKCLELKPDLIVLDVMLPGLNGVDILKQIIKESVQSRVLAISGFPTEEIVREMLRAGAHGFVEKTAPIQSLKNAIDHVAGGGTYFGPTVATLLRNAVSKPPQSDADLTAREREILQLVAEGHSTKEIAAILNLSVKTIDNHRSNLMNKLDIHDIASLTRYAIKVGLITV